MNRGALQSYGPFILDPAPLTMATSPEKSKAILLVDAMTSICNTTRLKSLEVVPRYMFISLDFGVSRKSDSISIRSVSTVIASFSRRDHCGAHRRKVAVAGWPALISTLVIRDDIMSKE